MITHEKNGLKWLEFESLQPFKHLSHGVLTRHKSDGSKNFNSLDLNVDFLSNSPEITQNLSKVKEVLNLNKIVFAKQVHQTTLIDIHLNNFSKEHVCDGFITNEKGIALFIKHADCQAALFYDPLKEVIGNVHAGWRGNVLNIYKKMIEKMVMKYNSNPKDILVCISPSLGPKHAEFKNYKNEFPDYFWPFEKTKNHFDLWAIAKLQLQKEGILENNIEIAEICTYENSEDFFSYRRENVTGRNASFISFL